MSCLTVKKRDVNIAKEVNSIFLNKSCHADTDEPRKLEDRDGLEFYRQVPYSNDIFKEGEEPVTIIS